MRKLFDVRYRSECRCVRHRFQTSPRFPRRFLLFLTWHDVRQCQTCLPTASDTLHSCAWLHAATWAALWHVPLLHMLGGAAGCFKVQQEQRCCMLVAAMPPSPTGSQSCAIQLFSQMPCPSSTSAYMIQPNRQRQLCSLGGMTLRGGVRQDTTQAGALSKAPLGILPRDMH